jgi:hypothetical protein
VCELRQIQELDSKSGALGLEDVVRPRTANAELEEKNHGVAGSQSGNFRIEISAAKIV